MTTSSFDAFRSPEESRRKKRRRGKFNGTSGAKQRRGNHGSGQRAFSDTGGREAPMVPDADFTSYYGRPIVKPAPWEEDVAAYLFLGGLAAGSALLAAGADLTNNRILRRNCRFVALAGAGLGTVALIRDLGRPERFLHMLRTFKVTSPMSVGSWILVTFSTGSGAAAAGEVARMIPLPPRLGAFLHRAERSGGLLAGGLGPGLAAYTAVLLTNTATPTWSGSRHHLPYVFAGSAALAAGGMAMIPTPVAAAAPAQRLTMLGSVVDLIATRIMFAQMDETEAEPLRTGEPGRLLRLSQGLAIVGGVGAVAARTLSTRAPTLARVIAGVSGGAAVVSSALNRLGVFRAGMASAKDPRFTVEPQKRRLARRRAQGETGDSITTV